MTKDIRIAGFSDRAAGALEPLPREFAEQVKVLADDPAEGVLWSDVIDHVRGGILSVRRGIAERGSHAPR